MNPRHLASSSAFFPVHRDLTHVRIDEYEFPAGFRFDRHGHSGTHLCYIARGGFEERSATSSRWCGTASLRLSPSGDQHDMRIGGEGLRCLVLHAPEPYGPRPDSRVYAKDPRLTALAQELQVEMAAGKQASPLAIEGVALELLAQALRFESSRAARRPPPWVRQLRDHLHDAFAAPPSLHELATEVGRHPMHVTRTFRAHFGCSVGEYVRRLQAKDAWRRITASNQPLAEIAVAAGYTDQSHMTRQLRRMLGYTPGKLRRAQTGRG